MEMGRTMIIGIYADADSTDPVNLFAHLKFWMNNYGEITSNDYDLNLSRANVPGIQKILQFHIRLPQAQLIRARYLPTGLIYSPRRLSPIVSRHELRRLVYNK